MSNEDADIDSMITTFNTAVRSKANVVRRRKIPWVTAKILDLCDKRRELKKKRKDSNLKDLRNTRK